MIERKVGELKSSPIISRHPSNPIIDKVPYAEGLVYNGSVIKYEGRYVMTMRVDHADVAAHRLTGKTTAALAFSDDGVRWEVCTQPCLDWQDDEIQAVTDPRLMLVHGRPLLTIAVQTTHGMQTYLLSTVDFDKWELVSWMVPDNRDVVIFPRKFVASPKAPSTTLPPLAERSRRVETEVYLRLERPFPTFGHGRREAFDVWIAESPDLVYWGRPRVLLDVEDVPYANDRLGAGTAPLRTERGWLVLFHAVDGDRGRGKNGWEDRWTQRYTAGVMLLDLDDPRRVIGVSKSPLIVPEASYEVDGGYRNNIVFPCGAVVEDDGEVKIYYGAADTCQCLAVANVDDLVDFALSRHG